MATIPVDSTINTDEQRAAARADVEAMRVAAIAFQAEIVTVPPRVVITEERGNIIFPDGGLIPEPIGGFAWVFDADGLPALAVLLSNTTAKVGAIFEIRHAGTYMLIVRVACTDIPTGNLINTTVKVGLSSTGGIAETIIGPSIATFIDNITVLKAPYIRQHPAELVVPNPNSLLRVALSKRDSSGTSGSFAVLAMVLLKVA